MTGRPTAGTSSATRTRSGSSPSTATTPTWCARSPRTSRPPGSRRRSSSGTGTGSVFVERNVGAWMHVDHGLGLYLYANANRRAPTNMHNNAISVNSMHRIRAAQDLALYNLTLTEEIARLQRHRAPGDLEQRPGLAGCPRGRGGADRDRRLVRGDLRGERGLRAAGRRAVPEPAGPAGGAAQRRLGHSHDRRRGGVRLLRAGPALHHGDVRAADQRPRVRRPQQGDHRRGGCRPGCRGASPPPAPCSRSGRSPMRSRRDSRTAWTPSRTGSAGS